MISSRSLTTNVICNKCIIPPTIHTFHGMERFVSTFGARLWMIIMSSCVPMRFRLRNGNYIGLPIMFLSLGGLWPPSGATTTPGISSTNRSRNTNGIGAIGTGGTIGKGGAKASTSM